MSNHRWMNFDVPGYLEKYLGHQNKGQLSWLSVLAQPLTQLWRGNSELIGWDEYRRRKFYESNLTGQTLSLQEHLNNEFDPDQRRIAIIHKRSSGLALPLKSEGYDTVKFSLASENKPVNIALQGEVSHELDVSFVVMIPSSVNSISVSAVVNEYKLAGRTFKIETN
ncbi:MAG: hypothetical protein N4A72_06225 [Bacteroidales bacterium]|nr:hypothetical protein [Bacteroidales bacterium]